MDRRSQLLAWKQAKEQRAKEAQEKIEADKRKNQRTPLKRRNTSCAAQKNVQKIKKNTLTKDLPVPEKIITVPKIKKSLSPPKETPSPEKARSDGILTAKIDNSNHRTEVSEGREDESEKERNRRRRRQTMFVRGTNSVSDENSVENVYQGVTTRRSSMLATIPSAQSSTDSSQAAWKLPGNDKASTPPCQHDKKGLNEVDETSGHDTAEGTLQLKCQLAMAIEEQQMLHFLSEVQRQQLEDQEAKHRIEMSELSLKYEKDTSELRAFADAIGTQLKQALQTALRRCNSLENEIEMLHEKGSSRSKSEEE